MLGKMTFLFIALTSTGLAAQSGSSDGVSNVNYEKVDCHCPTCVAAHPSWAVACGSSAKLGREASLPDQKPGRTDKTDRAY